MADLIDRRAATSIPILPKEHRKIFKSIDDAFETGWNEALSCVNMLPSVQPDHVADTGKKVCVDAISRQAALDALAKQMPKTYTPDGSHPADEEIYKIQEIYVDCIESIEILPAVQPEPHWIPCSERLPEKNCRCLTTNEAWGSFEVDWNAWIDGRWLYPNEKPIAWMPLTEPYRGGEK